LRLGIDGVFIDVKNKDTNQAAVVYSFSVFYQNFCAK